MSAASRAGMGAPQRSRLPSPCPAQRRSGVPCPRPVAGARTERKAVGVKTRMRKARLCLKTPTHFENPRFQNPPGYARASIWEAEFQAPAPARGRRRTSAPLFTLQLERPPPRTQSGGRPPAGGGQVDTTRISAQTCSTVAGRATACGDRRERGITRARCVLFSCAGPARWPQTDQRAT